MIRPCFRLGLLGLLCSSLILVPPARGQSLVEKLGYPAGSKLLLIHGDDIGMSHAANKASIDALDKGIVTCGSIMVPCPWFLEIAAYARAHPEADLGLHLTLTAEWKNYRWRPLADLAKVKGLIDPEGYMFHDVAPVYASACPEEIEAEVRAQIEFARAHGVTPTHLDSHMGTLYYNPEYLKVAWRLAEEYDIPFMLFSSASPVLSRTNNPDVKTLAQQLEARGVPLLDNLESIENTPVDQSESFYRDLIRNLQPGVTELIIHLADNSEEIQAITGNWRQRFADYTIFTDPKTKAFLDEQQVHLIGWKDLLPLWKNRQR